jgi:RNA polymerase sigma-70 factor (ECF subfamily)
LDDRPQRSASPGPDTSVAAVYDAYAVGLYRYALMILADRQGAEDAVQQAFTKLLSQADRAARLESPEAYLRTAVRNECYSMLRYRRDRRSTDADLLEIADAGLGNEEERIAVQTALLTLPPEQREVLYLKAYEGRTFQEIGDTLGESINTVASRYRYGIAKLREALAPMEQERRRR